MSNLERRDFHVGLKDHLGVFDFEDVPGELAIVAQTQPDETGVAQQRSIYFPNNHKVCAHLIRQIMEVSGITSVSLTKRGELKWRVGPK